jgi:hypothetical protein
MGQERPTGRDETRSQWESPEIEYVGDVDEIVLGGGGKLTISAADTGDSRKPKGLM